MMSFVGLVGLLCWVFVGWCCCLIMLFGLFLSGIVYLRCMRLLFYDASLGGFTFGVVFGCCVCLVGFCLDLWLYYVLFICFILLVCFWCFGY